MDIEYPEKLPRWKPPKNHHGLIYVFVGKQDGVPMYELRKPTPDERVWIIENYIRRHSGEVIKVPFLAFKLGVSDRTIQTILKDLRDKKIVECDEAVDENNRQTGNAYFWTGKADPIIGSPTLEDLYAKRDGYGFRSFSWEDFRMPETDDPAERIDQYFRYMELLDIRRKMKRKKDRRYRKCLSQLKRLGIRDRDEKRLG